MFQISVFCLGTMLALGIAQPAPVWPDAAAIVRPAATTAGSDLESDDDQDDVWQAQRSGDLMPFSQILDLAMAKIDGDIIDTEFGRKGDRVFYVFKFIDGSGRVRELALDARTGAPLAIGGE